jgi:hypothetical protein
MATTTTTTTTNDDDWITEEATREAMWPFVPALRYRPGQVLGPYELRCVCCGGWGGQSTDMEGIRVSMTRFGPRQYPIWIVRHRRNCVDDPT